ncbi:MULTISPECIES: GGDEF domain-containing protein [unclassified Acidovorax]|uniref:GGDEF domain-containing protein n=1 Tax=unclassified Acidovorax TaxID=2684926 RepID=UPI000B3F7F07|nr:MULTISPECIES: GGDEF domain-containing protein [unclassified Acidovorax]
MHSPTLVILAGILAALVTTVLYAVWHFNKGIPGLRLWMLSFLSGAVFCASLLVRDYVPEVLAVVLSQVSIAVAAYLCFLGGRAYMGRPPLPHAVAATAIVGVVAAAVYFTVVQPNLAIRFALAGSVSGVCFLLTAHTVARGGVRDVPARYLFSLVAGLHGLFLLLRQLLFRLAMPGSGEEAGADMVVLLSQFVVLEATLSLVLMAFGTLMLTNEHITRELRHLAEMDPLTDVFNRRAFLTLLEKAISSAHRIQSDLSVLAIDLDHFKMVNDTCGHKGGDDVLRHFVGLASGCLRNEDVMGRMGGEEFVIFLPNASRAGTLSVAERLRALVASQPVLTDRGPIHLTVSIGATQYLPGDSSDALLQRADDAMYLAKAHGRNRVEALAIAQPV